MRRASWDEGWFLKARIRPSPNHGPRPPLLQPSLIVLHSISLPPGVYRGDAIARLFFNQLDPTEHPYFASLDGVQVSAHFVIRRNGRMQQFVSCDRRAWHAGRSSWRGMENCNDYSIGIELEGLEGESFASGQYATLHRLVAALARRYPLSEVVGHEHVAPGRKGDPGPGFDWARLARDLAWPRRKFAPWIKNFLPGTFPKA